MAKSPKTVRLQDYQPYPFSVDETRLAFDIRDGETAVECELTVRRRGEGALVLNGNALPLDGVWLDGRRLGGNEYALDAETLTVFDVPDGARLRTATRIAPERNTALNGLYRSAGMYCTQCEPEGFRNIAFYPDRPDVLARFTTSISADAARFPVLLANGNKVDEAARDGRRTVVWRDPFPKPSYLFALVAGDLAVREDSFVTRSGRRVQLRIFSEPRNIGQCGHAMAALKRAMRWDERRFGREYDLDIFMIVAVEDFNFGAMENKGLNIFNTSCVLASPDTATDANYQRVEGVVAHEYFHNWSGNRVTCRDWFQLSLKEGFTVYRDAQFSAEMNAPTVKRVTDVDLLRAGQFTEDAGPLAHPVRPDSYQEISNFYTSTVYEKGAEVVGMLATILGRDGFRQGTDLYFDRHDGQAVTTGDFLRALEDANGVSLPQFRRWYEQAGTPELSVAERRQGDALTLVVDQSCPPSPGQPEKQPFHIPLAFGLLDADGAELLGAAGAAAGAAAALESAAVVENPNADGTLVAHLTENRTELRFSRVPAGAQVSFLRGFSAPVRVRYPRRPAVLRQLALKDSDGFARWDAAGQLVAEAVLASVRRDDAAPGLEDEVATLFRALADGAGTAAEDGEAKAILALLLTLPEESVLLDRAPGTDILAIHEAREALAARLAREVDWLALAAANETPGPYQATPAAIARRQLRHRALAYALRRLDERDPAAAEQLLAAALAAADNLTDRLAALTGLLSLRSLDEERRARHVAAFYERWAAEPLVVNAWFAAQSRCPRPGGLARVQALQRHPAFQIKNPDKVRALVLTFAARNPANFHVAGGAGYRWLAARVVALDAVNPQIASQLAKALTVWPRFDAERGRLMCAALRRVREAPELSGDVREVVDKGLANVPEGPPGAE